ncbi:alkaline phosphatase [Streptococcus uberis]|uniref:alkaline phosphatase n=1 Tax=Streptococcus uberis TaxID=1349 RepID=UPI0027DC1E34|nr:alkaline phosphatase [Streptococcus uberis]
MSPKKKSLKSLGMLLLASSLVLGACSQESALKIDTDAANSSKKAEKTANGKSVQMYDSKRPKTEDYSKVNDHQAKYVFLFIGDGMGVTPVTAAENYLGYTKTNKGEVYPTRMNFTEMPVIGLKSQYDCHSFIPDSASTATAFASGIKTQTNTVGLSGDFEKSSDSVAEKAKRAGKSVGILTTVTLNHATPAAFYANAESRSSYYDIGLQMADSNFDFFAGGSLKDRTGKENDQKDLYDVMKEKGYNVVETKAEAEKVDAKAKKNLHRL